MGLLAWEHLHQTSHHKHFWRLLRWGERAAPCGINQQIKGLIFLHLGWFYPTSDHIHNMDNLSRSESPFQYPHGWFGPSIHIPSMYILCTYIITPPPNVPFWALGGWVPCSRVHPQCSEGDLAPLLPLSFVQYGDWTRNPPLPNPIPYPQILLQSDVLNDGLLSTLLFNHYYYCDH